MNTQLSPSLVAYTTHKSIRLKLVLAFSALLEVVLFIGLFTDYSWNSTWANLLFPLLVGMIAFFAYRLTRPTLKTRQERWLKGLCYWPAMGYNLLYLVVICIAVLPPLCLTAGFGLTEELGRRTVQQVVSPDGTKIALVSFRPVGSYTSGSGRVDIQLTYKNLPYLKRDLYGIGKTYSPPNGTDWVEWRGNASLYIIDQQQLIDIGLVQFQIPGLFTVLFSLVVFLRLLLGSLIPGFTR